MQYYILMPGDDEKDAWLESNLLGDKSFNVFWAGQGFKTLQRIMMEDPEALSSITIKSENGRSLTITEFLDDIEGLQVRIN